VGSYAYGQMCGNGLESQDNYCPLRVDHVASRSSEHIEIVNGTES